MWETGVRKCATWGSLRWRVAADDPRVRRGTRGALSRHEDLGLAVDEMRHRERVPRASSPPERLTAHDREAERDRRERVRHHDAIARVEHDVASRGEAMDGTSRRVVIGSSGARPVSANDR